MTAEPLALLVNSIPKSGSYLVGRLLGCAGIPGTGFHLRRDRYWEWNKAESLDSIVKTPADYQRFSELDEVLSRIESGYTYAHLDHAPDIVAGLGRISVWQDYGSPKAEALFEAQSGKALNGVMGYDDDAT